MSDADRTRMRKRTVGFVFQKFNLLPNLTARDNIGIARYIAGLDPKPEAEFEEILKVLKIGHRLDHKPSELSGGEQQRPWPSRAPSSIIRRFCWRTSPRGIWIRRTRRPCWRCCAI